MTTRSAQPQPAQSSTVDRITFEVIRHRLWAINDDQAMMAARLSGSPIVYEGFDFNAALLTADGRALFAGVYIMHHAATLDVFVKQVLERWGKDEIAEGDMFFTNDPWSGALHSNDGILVAPIFWEGRIVSWAGIVMHDQDVGSPVPGSFVVGAADRFGEAPLFPPIKMVEKWILRRDVEGAFIRNHRMPDITSLNLRARIAAIRSTSERIRELIQSYGPDVFTACQEDILDYVERVVRSRLREIPDGEWVDQIYLDHNGITNEIYPIRCRLTKIEDRLVVDFTGTAKQAPGAVNCARPALEGSVLAVVLAVLCYDVPWSIGALRRIVEIVSEPGTINNALSPAGASMASIMGAISTQDVVANAFGKMLMASPKYRSEAQACWNAGINGQIYAGVTRDGDPFALPTGDVMGGGGGARSFADGIDSGGIFHSVSSSLQNVETNESRMPILQLYRKERQDSGGPGRFRGGVGIESAIMPHKVAQPLTVIITASGVSQPEGHGLSGGGPGVCKSNAVLRNSSILDLLAGGFVPSSMDEIAAEQIDYREAKDRTTLADKDVIVYVISGGGGFGDPIRRVPDSVLGDVEQGLVSKEIATSVYGVVIDNGMVDAAATEAARTGILKERLSRSRPAVRASRVEIVAGGITMHPVSDTVEMADLGGRIVQRCCICSCKLSEGGEDHLHGALVQELPLTALSPLNAHARTDLFAFRQYVCPGCGTSLAVHVQQRAETMLDESSFPSQSAGQPAETSLNV